MDDEKIVRLYWDRNEQTISESSDKYGVYCTNITNNILFSSPDDNFRLGQLGYIHYNYIFMISYVKCQGAPVVNSYGRGIFYGQKAGYPIIVRELYQPAGFWNAYNIFLKIFSSGILWHEKSS